MSGELQLFAFGRPRLRKEGQPLAELVSAKAQALLIYLAVTGKTYSRSALAGLLWGDMPEEAARANLRLTLTKLRKAVGEHLTITHEAVAFNVELPYQLDTATFLAHAARPAQTTPEQLRAALHLYQADFLEDFYVQDAPDFESWAAVERERLRQAAFNGWQYVAEQARARHDAAEGLTAARQVLALEPWREEAHRQLMEWLAESGQRSAALAQFEVCQHVLAEELGVAPARETVALYEAIKAQGQEEIDAQPIRLSLPSSHNLPASRGLPAPLTPLVGREAECAQVAEQLANPACRLLTLLGPGGIGKTRLALAAAERITTFSEGVFFTTLTGQMPTRPDEAVDELVTNIANALRYTFAAQQAPRELLLNYLADKTLLLILDNMEGWRPVSKFLAELLRRAPNVKLLLTSRERMGVMGEWLLEVKGLPFASAPTEYASSTYPAFQLFAQGAQRLRPELDAVTEAQAINRICQLVEGSPLGIELAARWVQTLTCAEIVARLEHSFDLLSTSDEPTDERHHSLRVVLVDSWRTLTEAEQQTFRQLSVFRGGFTLAAAERVAEATLTVLDGLINKSWLRLDEANGVRYRIHELLRQYGAEQLAAESDVDTAVHTQHSHYYAEFLQARREVLEDRTNPASLAEVDSEVDNVRAALDWLLVHGPAETLANGLSGFWSYARRKGWYQEATFMLARASQLTATSPLQLARWHLWLGEAYFQMGRVAESEEHFGQALELLGQPLPKTEGRWGLKLLAQVARQITHLIWPPTPSRSPLPQRQQWQDASTVFNNLGPLYYQMGNGLASLTSAFAGLNLAEQAGFADGLTRSYSGCCVTLGSLPIHALAARYGTLALKTASSASARAFALEAVGLYRLGLGQWAEAQTILEETLALNTQLEMYRDQIEALSLLAKIHYFRGEFEHAQRLHTEALQISQQQGDFSGEHWNLLGLAEIALRFGAVEVATIRGWLNRTIELQATHRMGMADVARFYGVVALAHYLQGQPTQAHEAAQLGLQLTQRNALAGVWTVEGFAALAETHLLLCEAQPTSAQRLANQKAIRTITALARIFPIAQPRAWLCEGWQAWLNGQSAQAERHWQKSLLLAEQLAMPYEQARAHYALGHYGQQPGHLQQAYELYNQLGCRAEAMKTDVA